MNDLKSRLTSRKFWIAVLSSAVFYLNGDVNQALIILLGYLGVEGYADAQRPQALN
jgi:uncharacterized membrane protein